jgi:hypothetical protein
MPPNPHVRVRATTAAQLFHSNAGAIAGNDAEEVQRLTNACTETFLRVGLKMNDKKTKVMAVEGAKAPNMTSKEAFNWQMSCGAASQKQ